MIVYVQIDNAYNEVINISLAQLRNSWIKAVLNDTTVDLSKLGSYKLELNEEDGQQYLVYSEDHYKSIVAAKQKAEAIEQGNQKLDELRQDLALEAASDEDAYIMRYLYDSWEPGASYVIGNRRLYENNLYKCKQDHTSEAQFTPNLIPALWDIIGDEAAGTIDNPVVVPDEVSSMVYIKGKYFLEGDTLYLMNREGMADGEEVSLTYKPSALVGQYFEVVDQ